MIWICFKCGHVNSADSWCQRCGVNRWNHELPRPRPRDKTPPDPPK